MRLKISNHKHFKNAMSVAELMVDEVKLECDTDGVRFRGIDRSHVAFMNMDIGKEYFDEYSIGQPETCIIDTSELVRVLKRIKNKDTLIIESGDENLKLQFIGESKRTFNIRQISMEYDSPSLPLLDYPCEITADHDRVLDSLKDCELYDTRVKMTVKEDFLILSSVGDMGEYVSEIIIPENIKDEHTSIFSTEWLKTFFKIGKISRYLKIKLGDDMPIQLRFIDEEFKTDFLLVPRIEENY